MCVYNLSHDPIRGGVMGVTVYVRDRRGLYFTVAEMECVRWQQGLYNEFCLSDVDIKRCHGFWSVTAYETGTACRREARLDED